MKTNVESLKTLYVKLGGALTDTYPNIAGGIPVGEYDLISDCILACSEKSSGGGGGSDLPEPGTSGNVLTSTGTAWESAAPNEFVVTAELVPGMGTMSFTGLSAEYDDIVDALLAGKSVRFYADYSSEQLNVAVDVPLSFGADALNQIIGLGIINNNGVTMMYSLIITVEDDATVAVPEFKLFLPAVSASNNGQILGVDNGAYALVSPASLSLTPLVIEGTVSGSTFTQTSSVTAEQIRDAIAAHRPIYIEDATMRLYYNYGGYTAADSFSYGFVGSLYDDTTNKRSDIFIVFEDSMATATMYNLKFSPDA